VTKVLLLLIETKVLLDTAGRLTVVRVVVVTMMMGGFQGERGRDTRRLGGRNFQGMLEAHPPKENDSIIAQFDHTSSTSSHPSIQGFPPLPPLPPGLPT
jgi:hypothetical protein